MLNELEQSATGKSIWEPGGRAPSTDEAKKILEEVGRVRAAIAANDAHAATWRGFLLGEIFHRLSIHAPAVDAMLPLAKAAAKFTSGNKAWRKERKDVKQEALAIYRNFMDKPKAKKTAAYKYVAEKTGVKESTLRSVILADDKSRKV